ncbi:MAG: Coenzyme F420 hydrogenase/dehydrogenase, beta subunit C-terminal domain [Clostridia bacterium]
MDICLKEKCTGCFACFNICKNNAITIKEDKEGFLFPIIDKSKCINCKKCFNVCPSNKNIELKKPSQVWAVINNNMQEYINSSSGGAFYVFAKEIINEGGKVYGACFNESLEVKHIRVETIDGLSKLRGSKYVQSQINDIYTKVKCDLENDTKVLFSGTPCQVAGLKNYLIKSYENLITIDLICHGVPSQKIFDKYIEYIGKGRKITDFKFRHKMKNDTNPVILHYKKGGKNHNNKTALTDTFYYAFLNGYICRESCYNCMYATEKRVGDITLGDFWGVEKHHVEFTHKNGVSAILINTKKGKTFYEKVKEDFVSVESNINFVKEKNSNLNHPSQRKEYRNDIYKELNEKGYKYIANKYFKVENRSLLKLKSIIPMKYKEKIVCFLKK